MAMQEIRIPLIEDEIAAAWQAWSEGDEDEALLTEECRATFEAGFRAARTFAVTGGTTTVSRVVSR